MGPFNFAVELGGSSLDVNMPYAFVFDMPMELGLPFVAAIGTERLDSKRELFDDVVGKVVSLPKFRTTQKESFLA